MCPGRPRPACGGACRRPERFRIRTIALRLDPVTTMGGVRIQPDLALADAPGRACAMLVLPGGESWDAGGARVAVGSAGR